MPERHMNKLVILISLLLLCGCSGGAADRLQADLQGEWECGAGSIVFTADKMNVNNQAEVDYKVVDGSHIRLVGNEATGDYIEIEVVLSGERLTLINQTRSSAAPENCNRIN